MPTISRRTVAFSLLAAAAVASLAAGTAPPPPELPAKLIPPPVSEPLPERPAPAVPGALPQRNLPEEHAAPAAAYTLQDLAFLVGAWDSTADGTYMEEHWSAAQGDSMIGMFRWVSPGGQAALFEILTLTQEPDGIILRLRHFTPTLESKEEKDAPPTLRLTEVEAKRAVFAAVQHAAPADRVVYELSAPDRLLFSLYFQPETGRPPLRLAFTRMKPVEAAVPSVQPEPQPQPQPEPQPEEAEPQEPDDD